MERYGIRAAKYTVYLIVLLTIMLTFMQLANLTNVELTSEELFKSGRGWLMIGFVVIFALLQPFLGYTKKTLVFDANQRAEDLDRVMEMCGYRKESDTPEQKTYRANSGIKKLMLVFEDRITVTTQNEVSVMKGPRKEVVRAYFRAGTFIG